MKNIKRNVAIFVLFARYAIKTTTQARLGLVLFTTGKLIRFLMFFFFIYFLVSRTNSLHGYSTNQAIIFFLTFNVIDTLGQLFFREVYRFRPLVVSGELDGILVKPYHPFLRVLVGGVDIMDAIMLVPYVLLTIYFVAQVPGLSVFSVFSYVLLIINALVIITAFHIFVLVLGILTTDVDHSIMIFRDVTSIGRFPIEIYQEPFRWFFTFIIPVGVMMSYPSKGLFGLLGPTSIGIALILALLLLSFSFSMWNVALRRYQSWGG